MSIVDRLWYGGQIGEPPGRSLRLLTWLLLPLAGLFRLIVERRRRQYLRAVSTGALARPPVPVIVVGNITVGGTGKTPVVIALIEQLRALGYRPGVVSRGYGGKPAALPLLVGRDTPADQCGDEPLLIHWRTGCPVAVDPDRPAALRHLLAETAIDVVISDDGLQHYRLYRDLELAVIDGQRGLGNGHCLPAGPLREPPSRLDSVAAVLVNGGGDQDAFPGALAFALQPSAFVNVRSGQRRAVEHFAKGQSVHALAGIGNPSRFFTTLRALGFSVDPHAFPDHHRFEARDIQFDGDAIVVMTEKDAVKCQTFADARHWYLAVDAQLPQQLLRDLPGRLASV